jgi:hypothetical protein
MIQLLPRKDPRDPWVREKMMGVIASLAQSIAVLQKLAKLVGIGE